MSTYERVTYRPEGERARTIYVENPRESGFTVPAVEGQAATTEPTLVGMQVGKDGDAVIREGDRIVVIARALVVRREPYEMDLHYAELVPLGTAKIPVGG